MTVLFDERVTASEGQARQHSDGEGDCAGQRWHLRTLRLHTPVLKPEDSQS